MNKFTPLVEIIDGEPLASTLVIAKGMKAQHASTIKLVRRYQARLERFGLVRFEIQPRSPGKHGGGDAEYAYLNERQSAFVISLMRNSNSVVDFKENLIYEFFRMRDALSQRTHNLWQQLQAAIAEEVESKVKATFGSRLMLDRKREKPLLEGRIMKLENEIQPTLPLH
ncbi:hypothetical protein E8K88_16375 [Lampropedia aestuarii]|uniref:Rha family transcriptional regulator n=1 Tax=Lampropedia aestuarii TaxID=2562762 RepID=A0A4S5BJW5_9BURK|nr:Rha family transcriptional regulator [Lampropedia aestuarii]THJ30941.1 hypothetical protein E8K88_16375 [Lampropedia aestuarii]